jgi:hypothetical protein
MAVSAKLCEIAAMVTVSAIKATLTPTPQVATRATARFTGV